MENTKCQKLGLKCDKIFSGVFAFVFDGVLANGGNDMADATTVGVVLVS